MAYLDITTEQKARAFATLEDEDKRNIFKKCKTDMGSLATFCGVNGIKISKPLFDKSIGNQQYKNKGLDFIFVWITQGMDTGSFADASLLHARTKSMAYPFVTDQLPLTFPLNSHT